MAVQIQVADVLESARFRLHQPAFGSAGFITEAAALTLVQSGVTRLSGLLTRLFGDSFFVLTATLTTQANLELVSLPANFAQLRSVHWIENGKAHELSRSDVHDYEETPRAWSTGDLPKFRIENNVLIFTPAPVQVHTLRVGYTSGLFVTSAADSIAGQVGWQEWLVLDFCEMVRDREEKDASSFTARKAAIEVQIKDQATQRDRYSVTQVRDVRGELDTCGRLFRNRRRPGDY